MVDQATVQIDGRRYTVSDGRDAEATARVVRQMNPAEATRCQHCGQEATPEDPVIVRYERLRSHGEVVQTTRCQNETACWQRWDKVHGFAS